jgi:hypothetical protein
LLTSASGGRHPPHLFEHGGILGALDGRIELIVRNAAQMKNDPRGQLEIANPIGVLLRPLKNRTLDVGAGAS